MSPHKTLADLRHQCGMLPKASLHTGWSYGQPHDPMALGQASSQLTQLSGMDSGSLSLFTDQHTELFNLRKSEVDTFSLSAVIIEECWCIIMAQAL